MSSDAKLLNFFCRFKWSFSRAESRYYKNVFYCFKIIHIFVSLNKVLNFTYFTRISRWSASFAVNDPLVCSKSKYLPIHEDINH